MEKSQIETRESSLFYSSSSTVTPLIHSFLHSLLWCVVCCSSSAWKQTNTTLFIRDKRDFLLTRASKQASKLPIMFLLSRHMFPTAFFIVAAVSVRESLAWTSPAALASSSSRRRCCRPYAVKTSSSPVFLFSQDSATADKNQDQINKKTTTTATDDNDDNWLATLTSSWQDAATTTFSTTTSTSTSTTSNNNNNNNNSGLLSIIQNTGESMQTVLDDATDGWALSTADLRPETPTTTAGQAFLATNLAYLLAGWYLQYVVGDVVLGVLTEVCALASFQYHYQQLLLGQTSSSGSSSSGSSSVNSSTAVRWALLLDYIFAGLAIGCATIDLTAAATTATTATTTMSSLSSVWTADHHHHALWLELLQAVGVTAAGLGFLTLSWKYEHGKPYMWWHSLWHVASAYAGFLIGNVHAAVVVAAAAAAAADGM